MGNIYPSQTRSVDPYASYHSNVVNRLTRMISRGQDCLHSPHSIDVEIDSTSPLTHVVVKSGEVFKDDVYFSVDNDFTVDFTDPQFYVSPPFNEAGYYYVLLNYEFVKARPAPKGSIQLLKPTERGLFNKQAHVFLKAVKVTFNGTNFEIDSVYDWDPENEDNKREYCQYYLGTENSLPWPYRPEYDEGRIIYVRDRDEVYYGMHGTWERFGAVRVVADTTLCEIGQMVYVGLDGKCHPASATSNATLADAGVLQVGPAHNGDGKVRLYGEIDHVPIEPGRTIEYGENVYLSKTHPGTVTDLIPGEFPQFLGVCVTPGSSTLECSMWLTPARVIGEGGGSPIEGTGDWYDRYQDLMLASIYKRLTVDTFINLDLVDTTKTTAEINTQNFHMEGLPGDWFYSKSLSEDYDSTAVQHCQLSGDGTGTVIWELSNDGGETWGPATLNRIHYFAEYVLGLDSTSALGFVIGEEVEGSISHKRGHVLWTDSTSVIGVNYTTGPNDFQLGETIVGNTSGATATLTSLVDKSQENDLRVRAQFITWASLDDYGVIYDPDQRIVHSNTDNAKNISTLYADVYTTPSEDNDGLPNLVTPLESCKDNLQEFVGSTGDTQTTPVYGSHYFIDSSANLSIAISQLDTALYASSPTGEMGNMRDYMGKVSIGATMPNYSSIRYISQGDNLTSSVGNLDDAIYNEVMKHSGNSTIPDGDGTPSVLLGGNKNGILLTSNTTPTTITNFDDATAGIEFTLMIGDDNTTIQNSANIRLKGAKDFSPNQLDNITFIYGSSGWHEISRSDNTDFTNEWTEADGAVTAKHNDKFLIDSTSSFEITLPPSPKFGTMVTFVDGAGLCSVNNTVVGRNGERIMGLSEDMNINIDYASFSLVYYNSSNGWRIAFQQ